MITNNNKTIDNIQIGNKTVKSISINNKWLYQKFMLTLNFVYVDGTTAKSTVTNISGTIGSRNVTLSNFTETNNGYQILCNYQDSYSLQFTYNLPTGYVADKNGKSGIMPATDVGDTTRIVYNAPPIIDDEPLL